MLHTSVGLACVAQHNAVLQWNAMRYGILLLMAQYVPLAVLAFYTAFSFGGFNMI